MGSAWHTVDSVDVCCYTLYRVQLVCISNLIRLMHVICPSRANNEILVSHNFLPSSIISSSASLSLSFIFHLALGLSLIPSHYWPCSQVLATTRIEFAHRTDRFVRIKAIPNFEHGNTTSILKHSQSFVSRYTHIADNSLWNDHFYLCFASVCFYFGAFFPSSSGCKRNHKITSHGTNTGCKTQSSYICCYLFVFK